jgi:tetratricopeptide (TPR) repeat protein
MAFKEAIIIADEQGWVWNFARQTLERARAKPFCLASDFPLRDSKDRILPDSPLIIDWDCKRRHAGALAEDLVLLAGDSGLSDRVIVLAANVTREDAIYFGELGIERIVMLRNRDVDLARSAHALQGHWQEASARLSGKATESGVEPKGIQERQWRTLLRRVDQAMEQHWFRSDAEKVKSEDGVEMAFSAARDLRNQSALSDQAWATLVEKGRAFIQREVTSSGQQSARTVELEACFCLLLGKTQDALDRWRKACELNPQYHRAHLNFSRCLRKLGRYEEALRVLHHRYEQNRLSIGLMVEIGDTHVEADDLLKAEHYYQQALERDPKAGLALAGLAQVRFARGEMESCRDLLKRCGMPSRASSRLNAAGIALVRAGHYEEALDLYKKAQFVLPQQEKGPMLFYNMGLCYLRWGREEVARDFLKLALIKDPSYEKAKALLSRMESR